MRRVFNPGRVPVVVSGHAVGGGEWGEIPDAGGSQIIEAGLLIEEAAKPKTEKKEPSR